MSSSNAERRDIVIIGGGVIGCTTAYYLTRHPGFSSSSMSVTILETSVKGPAQGASGKAGGLIAKWAYPQELASVSFREHVKLAEEHDGANQWGWRFVECGNWKGEASFTSTSSTQMLSGGLTTWPNKAEAVSKGQAESDEKHEKTRSGKGLPDDLDWVKEELTTSYTPIAPSGDTAQVHPYLFTAKMLKLSTDKGAVFKQGQATTIVKQYGQVKGVKYEGADLGIMEGFLPATHVILCAGPWSPALLPQLPISSVCAHSITVRLQPSAKVNPYALFTDIVLRDPHQPSRNTTVVAPEIYSRPNNQIYATGPGEDILLPASVDDVFVDHGTCKNVYDQVCSISQELKDGTLERLQACFLPVVSSGNGPIVGEDRSRARGLFIATGHSCWGITNAPGTAKAMSELVMEGEISCADLQKLEPVKFYS